MTPPIDLVIDALRDKGFEPKQIGDGYKSRCPAHEDHNPSLSISVGNENQVLFHCFAQQCTCKQICVALNLRESDLFVNPIGNAAQPPSSKLAEVCGTTAAPSATSVTAEEGTGCMPIVIGVTVKLPALKPELTVADAPGQTPETEVETKAEGNG